MNEKWVKIPFSTSTYHRGKRDEIRTQKIILPAIHLFIRILKAHTYILFMIYNLAEARRRK